MVDAKQFMKSMISFSFKHFSGTQYMRFHYIRLTDKLKKRGNK